MADYHEIPAEEMPDYMPDEYADTDVDTYDSTTANDAIYEDETGAASHEQSDELDSVYGGWSLPRLFLLMLALVIIAVLLMQLLIPAAYQVLHPAPTPTLRPPWMA